MTSSPPVPESEAPHASSSLVTKSLVRKMKSRCGELGANVDVKEAVTIGWGSSAEPQRNGQWNIYPEALSKWELALGQRTWQWRSQPEEPWWAGGKMNLWGSQQSRPGLWYGSQWKGLQAAAFEKAKHQRVPGLPSDLYSPYLFQMRLLTWDYTRKRVPGNGISSLRVSKMAVVMVEMCARLTTGNLA